MRIQKIMNIPPNAGPISTFISTVTRNLLPPEAVHSIFRFLFSQSFRLFSYIATLIYPECLPESQKTKRIPLPLTALSFPHRVLVFRFSREWKSEKVEGIVHTLYAKVLKPFWSYLIFQINLSRQTIFKYRHKYTLGKRITLFMNRKSLAD